MLAMRVFVSLSIRLGEQNVAPTFVTTILLTTSVLLGAFFQLCDVRTMKCSMTLHCGMRSSRAREQAAFSGRKLSSYSENMCNALYVIIKRRASEQQLFVREADEFSAQKCRRVMSKQHDCAAFICSGQLARFHVSWSSAQAST